MKQHVYIVSGGVSPSELDEPDGPYYTRVKQAYTYALESLGVKFHDGPACVDGAVVSYTPSHFPSLQSPETIVMESLELSQKTIILANQGDGGACFHEAAKQIISGKMDICIACGWESMSAKLSMPVFDPLQKTEFTVEQLARVAVKNYRNAAYNPYAHPRGMIDLGDGKTIDAANLTIEHIREATQVAWPLTRIDVSNSAAVCILANENGLRRLRNAGGKPKHAVIVSGIGYAPCTTETLSCQSTQTAATQAYAKAGIKYPRWELDFIELCDPDTPSEIAAYEQMGLCENGKGGAFLEYGFPFLNAVDYGNACKQEPRRRNIAVNPSGGVIGCGHAGATTGLRQSIFGFWQIQGSVKDHFKSSKLQVPNAKRGAIHSHTDSGASVSILER